MMTWEGAASAAMFSVTSSGILAAFALVLGANNFQIGILAAIPFITQPLQIPAIFLVEKYRRRKAIALLSWVPAQLMWIPMALVPFLVDTPNQLAVELLLLFLAVRGVMAAITGTAWNSWARDLVPQNILGSYFSRRLALATIVSIIFGLAGAFFVDFWQGQASPESQVFGYSFVLLAGAIFLGLASPLFMSLQPEPLMTPIAGPQPSLAQSLAIPFRDRNFRQLVNFLLFWGFAANLAIPFFTIYMLQVLGFPLSGVIALNILAQITNVLFVRVWGPFADRFGSKVVLSTSVSLYLLVILGWVFTTQPDRYFLTVPLVIVLQIFAGVAAAGANLTIGTIGLKLAPQGQATSYMAVASLATNLGAGLGPLVGGLFADFFSTRSFRVNFQWIAPDRMIEFPALDLTGFDFLFGIAFVIGLITLNTLTTIREEGEVGREVVMDELLAPSRGMTRALGSIPGMGLLVDYPYAYLRRVPGLDVALGVTAYQVASTIRTAVAAVGRGRDGAESVAQRVRSAVLGLVSQADELGQAGADLALYTAKGAMNAIDEVAENVGELAKGTVIGVIAGMSATSVDIRDVIRGAAHGAVQGANESGADISDIVEAATSAVAAAKEAGVLGGISEQEAGAQAVQGAREAANAIGPDAASRVMAALAEAP
ncbi:MAG TPA: MFS transporter [Dehalococcoidia bacterium]|nr:MFS transporter [Dehalococcoidia bacterium]